MQIKTLLHSKGFALSLVLKVRVSGTRKWPIHQAKKSVGPVCLTRALNIHIRIRQNTYSNRAIGKTIRFVKELSLAIRTICTNGKFLSRLVWPFLVNCLLYVISGSGGFKMRNGAKLDCISLQGHPMTWFCKITVTKRQIYTTSKSLKLQKG